MKTTAFLFSGFHSCFSRFRSPAQANAYTPNLNPGDFIQGVDNPYYPLTSGARWICEASLPNGSTEHIEIRSSSGDSRSNGRPGHCRARDTMTVLALRGTPLPPAGESLSRVSRLRRRGRTGVRGYSCPRSAWVQLAWRPAPIILARIFPRSGRKQRSHGHRWNKGLSGKANKRKEGIKP